MKKWMVIVITSCIVISLLVFIQATDLERVTSSVQKVGYQFCWLILLTGIAYFWGTLSWRYCLGDNYQSVSILRLFLIRHIGETVSLFNPTSIIGGDSVKALMLENYGIEKKQVIVSVILSRVILIASQLMLFLLTVLVLLMQYAGFSSANSYEKVLGLSPFILVRTRYLRLKIVEFMGEVPPLFRQNSNALAWSAFFAILHWIFGALEFYFILTSLGTEVTILQALLIDLGVVFFKAAGSFIPGQLGVEEYGNKIMLLAIGIPNPAIWISASILRRARQLVWIAFGIAVYFLLFHSRTLFHRK